MANKNKKTVLVLVIATLLAMPQVWAVRPFITDDATLIGRKRIEFANWTYLYPKDKWGWELWHSANIGLTNWAELTVAMCWGQGLGINSGGFETKLWSYTLPLLQAKFLLHDYEPNRWPGVTIAVGSDLPWGKGPYVASGYGAFAFVSVTQCIGKNENVLIHGQIGGAWETYIDNNKRKHQGGVVFELGTQVKIYKGFHGIAEIVNGDPYIQNVGLMFQVGIRQFISDKLQVDCAFGSGIGKNSANYMITAGIRYVFSFNKDTNFAPNGRKIK
jgi:hypothetical protein